MLYSKIVALCNLLKNFRKAELQTRVIPATEYLARVAPIRRRQGYD